MSISKVEKLSDEFGYHRLPMRLVSRLTAGVALGITVCWALALAFAGSTDVLLFLAPALLVIAPLIAGHYVGETLIAKLATKQPGRRNRTAARAPTPRPPAVWLPRGARLIALSLAERPPPARLLPQT
ncbi:MAG TPA: hypothetical protein VGH58_01735 [Solirubrobacterales bacterium]|jgi:hypothetical protein